MSNKKERKTMKKLSILLGSALVMLTAGCTKDATKDVAPSDKVTVFEMNIEGEADARTVLDGRDVLWSEGDCVAINGKKVTVAKEYVGTKSARFEVADVGDAPYRVIYPAEAYNDDGTITVSEIQEYAPNSFAQGAAVMVGYGETTAIRLQNLYGLVKITIKKEGDERIQSVTLHSNNLEAMTGTFTVDYATAAMTPLAGMDFVKVVSSAGIDYDDEGKAVIYIAVPAGTYAKGFTVKVATDNGTMSRSANSKTGATIERNTIYEMGELTYKLNETSAVESITTAEQLQAFLNAVNAGDYAKYKAGNGEVQLGDDIDLKGKTITPADSLFNGVFNGRGHKLINWKTSNGLFNKNSGTIKNIKIDKSCELTLPQITAASVFGFIVNTNTGIVSGCENYADMTLTVTGDLGFQYKAAPIVGYSTGENALVTNCFNGGDITITLGNLTAASHYFGGIVGNTSSADGVDCLTNCINNGNLSVIVNGATSKNMYLGGLSGACNHNGQVNKCVNRGEVRYEFPTGSGGAYPNIGGIVGYSAADISNSTNYGNVTFTTNGNITRPAVAGIAGYMNGDGDNLVNYGNILASGNKFQKASSADGGGVGGAQWPIVAGVVGCTGSVASGAKKALTNSYNYGNVTMINPNGSCVCGCAGVVAYASGNVINCHNEGDITASAGTQIYIAGVEGFQYIGGDKLQNCTNKGNITLNAGKEATNSYSYVSGIIGSYSKYSGSTATDCTNYGKVVSNWHKKVLVGGIAGCLRGTYTNCVNYGDLELNGAAASASGNKSCVAGVAGFGGGNSVGCANYGKVTNNSTNEFVSASGYIGVAGNTEQSHTGGIVKCGIVSANANIAILFGGQQNAKQAITMGTADAPIVIKNGTTLNGEAVTETTIQDATKLATSLETANASKIAYSIGTTIKFE